MERIFTDLPSSGKPIQITLVDAPNEWVTVLEATDFSVPGDEAREVVPGQLYIVAPLIVSNKIGIPGTVQAKIVKENNTEVIVFPELPVPGNDALLIPINGQTLLKSSSESNHGDRLQILVSAEGSFDIFGNAVESEMPTHAPDTESEIV